MRQFTPWRWHLDEVFVWINGKQKYLWRSMLQSTTTSIRIAISSAETTTKPDARPPWLSGNPSWDDQAWAGALAPERRKAAVGLTASAADAYRQVMVGDATKDEAAVGFVSKTILGVGGIVVGGAVGEFLGGPPGALAGGIKGGITDNIMGGRIQQQYVDLKLSFVMAYRDFLINNGMMPH